MHILSGIAFLVILVNFVTVLKEKRFLEQFYKALFDHKHSGRVSGSIHQILSLLCSILNVEFTTKESFKGVCVLDLKVWHKILKNCNLKLCKLTHKDKIIELHLKSSEVNQDDVDSLESSIRFVKNLKLVVSK